MDMPLPKMIAVFVSVLLVVWFYRWTKDQWFRRRGMRIERKAAQALRLPRGWEMVHDKPVPGLGNCDVLITKPNKQSFAVEIKSAESAKKVWFSLFTKDQIRKANGERFPRDHAAQALAVAQRLDAVPVLWFPKARQSKRFTTRNGVLVVLGGHKKLERAIGARGWFWL